MRAAVARAAADCAVDDERAAAARAVGGGAADGAGRSALISGVQGSVRGNVQGTHDRTRLAMLLLLYYNILCSKSGVTYAKGLTGPNSCRVHNQTPQSRGYQTEKCPCSTAYLRTQVASSSCGLLDSSVRQTAGITDQIDQMLSDWAQPPIRPRNVRVQLNAETCVLQRAGHPRPHVASVLAQRPQ